MTRIFALARRFWADESGATMVEYGLMVGLIAVSALVMVTLMGVATNNLFRANGDALKNALNGSS